MDFNPRSPHGERHKEDAKWHEQSHFNPRSPHGERPRRQPRTAPAEVISTHAPRTGSDGKPWGDEGAGGNFNPRSPHGERLRNLAALARPETISTHAPRTGSDSNFLVESYTPLVISTHAPRTGSDLADVVPVPQLRDFNPRSPHGERLWRLSHCHYNTGFQPTLPARGATRALRLRMQPNGHFNPRSPHGERRNTTL